jgi:hypothetical protein
MFSRKNLTGIQMRPSLLRCSLQVTWDCAKRCCWLSRSLFAANPVELQPKAPYSKRMNTGSGIMRMVAVCAPAICFKRYIAGTAAPRARQVAAPTTSSLCKASHAQIKHGSAGIYSPTISGLCLATISVPTTTLAASTAPPAPSASWPAVCAWRSCPTAPQAA